MTDILSWTRLGGPFLIGHRGHPAAARENTLPAFEAALEAGCDGVELDVRLTADGVPVVHHDAAARGPAGEIALETAAWPELEAMRFEGEGGPYRLPRLAGVLRALAGRCLVNVEVKTPAPGRLEAAAEAVVEALDRARPRESVLVSSFDAGVLAALHRRDASLLLGYLFDRPEALNHLEEQEVVDSLHALHPRRDLVDRRFMKRAQERGLVVNAWTVDDPAEALRLVRLGVTAVITNRPEAVGEALAGEVGD